MHTRVSATIQRLLDEAESREACLGTTERNLRRALERRVKTGELVSPRPSLYARKERWEQLDVTSRTLWKLRGLSRLHPNWVFCGPSAALLHGLDVSYRLQDTVHLAVRASDNKRSCGDVRRHVIEGEYLVMAGGAPTTSLVRTVFDCMRWLSFREGLVVADSALRTGLLTREDLLAYADGHPGCRGLAQARMTAAHADGRSENGGESIARAVMWELGFAVPELQVEVANPSGEGVFRVDYRWVLPDGREILGELDGGEKYVNPLMNGGSPVAALRAERLRESRLTVTRASIMRFSPADVANTAFFDRLLTLYGVPKDHEPLIEVPAPDEPSWTEEAPPLELVPVEVYGV